MNVYIKLELGDEVFFWYAFDGHCFEEEIRESNLQYIEAYDIYERSPCRAYSYKIKTSALVKELFNV